MKAIEILKAIRDDRNVRFLDDTLDKAISELEDDKDRENIIKELSEIINDLTNGGSVEYATSECYNIFQDYRS